jgi:hypothetical protein
MLTNFELMWVQFRFFSRFQARTSFPRVFSFGIRRVPRHWRESMPISISAWFSQLPCLGYRIGEAVPHFAASPFAEQVRQ